MNLSALSFAALALVALLAATPARVAAAPETTLSGTVVRADDGLAVSGAAISLVQDTREIAHATSDVAGRYTFAHLVPGVYTLDVRAVGAQPERIDGVVVKAGTNEPVRIQLAGARTGADDVREIGRAAGAPASAPLPSAATSTMTYSLDPVQLHDLGYVRAVDALATLPGVNLSGGPNSIGDDTFLDIRGAGPSETRTLIDGHPVGPGGAIALNSSNPQNYVYDFANSAFALMDDLRVTVGSGATGLYGVNAIGGTVDFETLAPTKATHADLEQQIGGSGTLSTVAKLTGSAGPLGYAFGSSVQGTYNDFAPTTLFQSARPNNNLNLPNGGACVAGTFDLTSCNQALNTYPVSGNYLVRTNLAKLHYAFSPATSLTLTTYLSNESSDATGNSDNDAVPYATRLAAIEGSGTSGTGGCGPGLYPVVTDANPNACETAQQWAAASSGPDGGGAQRALGVRLSDYAARFTTAIGIHTISLSDYTDFYQYSNFSAAAAGLDPTGTFDVGNSYSSTFLTSGFSISDDLAWGANELGFGWFVEHQLGAGNTYSVDANFQNPTWTPYPDAGSGQWSYFIRDAYTPSTPLSAYVNAWLTRSNVTNQTKFDPRLSLVDALTPVDVVRLTAGRSDGFPNAALTSGGVQPIPANLSGLESLCPAPGSYGIASAANPNLGSEQATDLEAAYSHRFWSDSSFTVVGYVSSELQQLFQITVPLTSLPGVAATPSIQSLLAQYAPKITSNCGLTTPLDTTTVQQYLGVLTTINVASAMYRGVEFQGRLRASRNLYFDYSYAVATAQQFGVPDSVLQNAASAFVINGAQIYEIPVQKGSLTVDFQNHRGFELQLAGYYTGNNNTYNRPAYTTFNAFASKAVGKHVSFVLSASNVFGQNVQNFQFFGEQVLGATNRYFPYGSAIDQANGLGYTTQTQLIGLQAPVVSLTLKLRL